MSLVLHRFGLSTSALLPAKTREKYGAMIDVQVERLEKIVDEKTAKAAQIQSDHNLSGMGRIAATKKLEEGVTAQLTAMKQNAKLADDLQTLRAALPTKLPAVRRDDVAAQIRHSEIRAALKGLDPVRRQSALETAADGGDIEVLQAIVDAPMSGLFPMVDKGVLDGLVQRSLRAAHADAFAELDVVENAANFWRANLGLAAKAAGVKLIDQPKAA